MTNSLNTDKGAALKEQEAALLCNTYGRYPLALERGEGAYLYGTDGTRYVDLLAGIAVANVGHANPEIADAVDRQMRTLVHVSNLFYQGPQLELAQAMLATTHADKVFFCNSGAEANEAAIKMARRYMQMVKGKDAYEVLTLESSFHGRTLATLTATGQDKVKEGFAPLPDGFAAVPWGDLDALAARITDKTAAVLVEVIQGEGGIRPMTQEYAKGIEKLCRDKGILFMVDEIQTGMGRTGAMWAHQHYGLTPDVFSVAKGLANGLPMGAICCTDEAAKAFAPGSHATTFGGGPVVSVAAREVFRIIERDGLLAATAHKGEALMGRLRAIQAARPDKIKDVRGKGLLIGVDLAMDGAPVLAALRDKGYIANVTQGTVLRVAPPLVIEQAELDGFVDTLDGILAEL